MAIGRLYKNEKKSIISFLKKNLDTGTLESVLSEEDVFLSFQKQILFLNANERHKKLSEIVVSILGDRVLQSAVIRNALSDKLNIESPNNWKPGTSSSIDYCKRLGLPVLLAGTQPPAPEPAIVPLGEKKKLPEITDYQREVYTKALEIINSKPSAMLSLPTGGGKTRVATEVLCSIHQQSDKNMTSIWLAHTEELCEQAAQCIIQVWESSSPVPDTVLYRAWGRNKNRIIKGEIYQITEKYSLETKRHSIIISTPKTIVSALDVINESSLGQALNNISIVVTDEAHRAAASTYKKAIDRIRKASKVKVFSLGLSATPVRETYSAHKYDGTIELSNMFEELIEPTESLGVNNSPVAALQDKGVLAKLDVVKLNINEASFKELAQHIKISREKRRIKSPSLFFSSNVSNAKIMALHLIEEGVRSEYVSSSTNTAERLQIINALRLGEIDVLCNCEILTTGFDAPLIEDIYLARNTNSPVLYKQIVGRGLRGPAFGGSEKCTLHLCGFDLPFNPDPNTSEFARIVWGDL